MKTKPMIKNWLPHVYKILRLKKQVEFSFFFKTCFILFSRSKKKNTYSRNEILWLRNVFLRPYSHETFWRTILRYCDKKIKRYCDKKIFFSSKYCSYISKSSQIKRKKYFQFTQWKKYWLKNVFLSQYLLSLYRNIVCENVSCE